ncbi:unnamed protein product [Rotaria socialis]|uniref:K Homology domain-containing protein n=1 Tax=Rotaria socialis TaxID=392032 RepID=A0A817XNR1_9BILA|nr:unnamed protein product [Rotaria socialis]CAF3341702.1 unnamed protein product [Rotaria socialis]CAF3370617.1 unnamed protein product [Rotaria socialis]CAF3511878.1 unnamed protein product [Rotaria socialis]CAF4116511.1 unnamed protein product [Rotaria socialis]
MINNTSAFQDALARARQVAQKITAAAPNAPATSSLKRPNNDDDFSNKRPAFTSPTQSNDIPPPVLRAQLVAQQINSQLGVKSSPADLSSFPLSNQSTFQEDYKIPDKFVGLIIGKGGEQIIRLQAESSCKVQICQTRPDPVPGGPNPPDRLANLSGSREAIERAKRIMDDIIAKGKMAEGGPMGINPYSMGGTNIKSIDVMLPSAKCGLVIGKGGENIKRVSEEFGVKMYVAQDTTEIDGIEHKPLKMTGEADKVERAKQYILDSLAKSGGIPMPNRFNSNSSNTTSFNDYGSRTGGTPMSGPCNEATYHAPHDKAGIIIGKGGESIKEINRKSGAFVELDKAYTPAIGNSSDRLFKLRGTPEQIVQAQQLMYEKIINSPGGPGDMLTPSQFQQQFNLPLLGSSVADSWSGNNDPYANDTNGAAASDPYSQWASAYGQWPAMNPYENSTSNNNSSSSTDASAMSQMDPAWVAYYQSMNYYNMMQASMTGTTSSAAATSTAKATDSTATSSTTAAVNATTGQPDYSQQWIEYYRSVGQNDIADQIMQQMKESGSSSATGSNSSSSTAAAQAAAAAAMMMSASNPWAAYAQQWNGGANGVGPTAANTTNGSSSSNAPSS